MAIQTAGKAAPVNGLIAFLWAPTRVQGGVRATSRKKRGNHSPQRGYALERATNPPSINRRAFRAASAEVRARLETRKCVRSQINDRPCICEVKQIGEAT